MYRKRMVYYIFKFQEVVSHYVYNMLCLLSTFSLNVYFFNTCVDFFIICLLWDKFFLASCLNAYNDPCTVSLVLKRIFFYISCVTHVCCEYVYQRPFPVDLSFLISLFFFWLFIVCITITLLQEPMGPCTRPRISRPRRSSLWRRCGSPWQRTGSPCPYCGRSRCYATLANTTIPTLFDWSTYATDRDTIGRWSSTSYSSTSIREASITATFVSCFYFFKGDNSV